MRRSSVFFLLVCVALLTGCIRPSPPWEPPPDPYPYSFTDSSKPFYPLGLYGARLFVSDVRARWVYQANVGAQYPADSFRWMSGDCDDFAIMLAYYLQEYWRYDTFILMLNSIDGVSTDHGCAFVLASSGVADEATSCPDGYPYVHPNGVDYYPVDFSACPWWDWTNYFPRFVILTDQASGVQSLKVFWEWYELAGIPTLGAD
jgi:hypothetical protein